MIRILVFSFLLFGLTFQLSAQQKPMVLIAYYSQSGSTKAMAEAVAEGANDKSDVEVRLLSVEEVSEKDLQEASAIVVGSPVYNANVAPAVLEFINSWPFEGRPLQDKVGAAFATGGGISIGEELVMLHILQAMLVQGMIVVGGEETESAFGASGVTGEKPFDSELAPVFLEKGKGLGRRVASLAKSMPR